MNTPRLSNLLFFLLFFGIALLRAISEQNWLEFLLFLLLGILSLFADLRGKKTE